ncbi:MAG: endolytic transglycosylase MltG [bacterium]
MNLTKKIKIGKWQICFLFVFLFVLVFCSLFIFAYYQIKTPLDNQWSESIFIIEKGQGLEKVAFNLEKANLIKDDKWFMFYVFLKGWTSNLQAGEYSLSPCLDISQIANRIVDGQAISQEISITIPEGFNIKQIDNRLSEANLIEAGELLNYSYLEGYLFPDTYRFNKNADLDEIIAKIRNNFDIKIDEDLKKEIKRQGKTINEIIIMASLIEREVATNNDKKIVSGIFWNRIRDNYPLQSCATIAYILDIDKWRYSISDTKTDSPYNTYLNVGLPPGPICNPGILAIQAAVYPQQNDYYFFLSTPDGETIFSRTGEEHNANKEKYLK